MTPGSHAVAARALKIVLLVVLGVAVALPTAYSTFVHSERSIVIGAHDAVVKPTFDGYARIDFGTLIPQIRLPADAPLGIGVDIRLGDSDISELNELIARDAVIASQPQGEIAAVRSSLVSMLADAAMRGVGAGALAVVGAMVGWWAIGRARRRAIWVAARHPQRRQLVGAASVGVVTAAALVLVAVPERPQSRDAAWVPIGSVFPLLPADPVLDRVEIVQGASTSGSKALVEGALETYRTSVSFYGTLEETARTAVVRTPEEGETTALVVTDRHDNIGMDPVARAIADRAGAKLLIDLGDDTSNGASWESFSINSLAREFRDFDIVSVAGNHDTGGTVSRQMKDKGFTVLDGKPVTVAGIRFIGSSDPRSSGLTAGYSGDPKANSAAIRKQDEELTAATCEAGDVSVVAVHSPSSGKQAAASGCADLVLSGHLHRTVGPEVVAGANGRTTTTLTTASTGGAVYAFALGSKLRRTAQVTIVTFADGRPVGLQPVSFEPGGIVTVADYVPVETSPR
ncbi:metallophosphoesterase family protein [Aeromicrobium wangtongii]|uniref:Metallophosphoesterase family protein n=1 Tax=Aeromicrobium wangtongii TaxID=2969247 RepID=A0ABY5M619_9ACTN|nr:metallophosphoesterase family protein [Aeromicrobium wangtongii]MCD9199996.1 metallophosphoesterase family protein [Aeromicrobium wangtongii]UUP13613.1 metallophosphoesterase family protein [Aeromicrobium wangtongii]